MIILTATMLLLYFLTLIQGLQQPAAGRVSFEQLRYPFPFYI